MTTIKTKYPKIIKHEIYDDIMDSITTEPRSDFVGGLTFPDSQENLRFDYTPFFNEEDVLNTFRVQSNISGTPQFVARDIRTNIPLKRYEAPYINDFPTLQYNMIKYFLIKHNKNLYSLSQGVTSPTLQRAKPYYEPQDPLIPCPMLQWLTSYLFEISNTQVRKVSIKDDLEIIL